MEKANRERIKEISLIAFVVVCLGFIFMIWVDGLMNKEEETPYFYRELPGQSDDSIMYEATDTARAEQRLLSTETPTSLQASPLLITSPTITPTLLFTPEADT